MSRLRFHPLWQLTLVKVREFLREPEAMFWIFVFPIVLALALGIAFRSGEAGPILVGVQQGPGATEIHADLQAVDGIEAWLLSAGEAEDRLRRGKVALVVAPGDPWVYRLDPTRPESRLAELTVDAVLQAAAGRVDAHATEIVAVTDPGSRYIDFLIPGLLGMNLMGTGMWGIGFYIVSARSKRLLKRLVATPMRRSDFLLSQITGRMVFLVLEVGAIVLFARLVFGVPLRGSLIALGVVCILGALAFGGLGLLIAARSRTIEGVSGLMNFVMVPMWICSGTFFSTSRFPDVMQPAVQLLPLTAVNDALRAVMLDGAGLGTLAGELAILGGWALVSLTTALRLFRWS